MQTPYYLYDIKILRETLDSLEQKKNKYGFKVHYAVKANANPRILDEIKNFGLGADCVTGNEIKLAIKSGINVNKIVFAGVGKTKQELEYAILSNISVINVESWEELDLINILAKQHNKIVNIAFRITPDIYANTHKKISTGALQHKFGFYTEELLELIQKGNQFKNVNIIGLHFHIGSQITDLSVFKELAKKAGDINKRFLDADYNIKILNMGGGLGVDYKNAKTNKIPDFKEYFSIFNMHLKRKASQEVHFELGRSIVANCGSLITKILYTKKNSLKNFIIVDAGMTDLIRPALYNAKHYIENITSNKKVEKYDVVGPVCETSDVFSENTKLNKCSQGDLLKIYTAGAYGEVMASNYNLREKPKSFFTNCFQKVV